MGGGCGLALACDFRIGDATTRMGIPAARLGIGRGLIGQQVWLGGRWFTFDPRNNTPRIGRVLMARGRDAVDVALTTTFGVTRLAQFTVWTDEVSDAALAEPPGVPAPAV